MWLKQDSMTERYVVATNASLAAFRRSVAFPTVHTRSAMASTSSGGNWLSMFHYVVARCLSHASIMLEVPLIDQNRMPCYYICRTLELPPFQ